MYRWVLDVGITVKFHENLLNGFMLDIRLSGLCNDKLQSCRPVTLYSGCNVNGTNFDISSSKDC